MDTGGPYVNAALICEKVLQETDGVLSVVRIIDRFTIVTVAAARQMRFPPGSSISMWSSC